MTRGWLIRGRVAVAHDCPDPHDYPFESWTLSPSSYDETRMVQLGSGIWTMENHRVQGFRIHHRPPGYTSRVLDDVWMVSWVRRTSDDDSWGFWMERRAALDRLSWNMDSGEAAFWCSQFPARGRYVRVPWHTYLFGEEPE